MRVLVKFAVDEEFAPWRKLRHFRFIDYDGLRLWKTSSAGIEATALITGMGTQAAAQAMGLMMSMADENRHFDICISSGLAGALKEGLKPGDIIAPQMLLAERIHADLASDQLRVDDDLRQRALGAGAICSDCLFHGESAGEGATERDLRVQSAIRRHGKLRDRESGESLGSADGGASSNQRPGGGRLADRFQSYDFQREPNQRWESDDRIGQESIGVAALAPVRKAKQTRRTTIGNVS